jgi:succinylarginine dihydrolase
MVSKLLNKRNTDKENGANEIMADKPLKPVHANSSATTIYTANSAIVVRSTDAVAANDQSLMLDHALLESDFIM